MTVEEIAQIEAAYQTASAQWTKARERRRQAVRDALASGMTHAQIADALGVSRGRVGQLAAA